MIDMRHPTTLDDLILTGRAMKNALELESFAQVILDRGTDVYTFHMNGETVAAISVDQHIVTNIVGPHNARISSLLLGMIKVMLEGIATVRDGHTHLYCGVNEEPASC